MPDRLVNARGEQMMTEGEMAARVAQIVKAATKPGLKKLYACKDMWEAQMLWATGDVTAEEMTAFLLINLGHDLRYIKAAFEQLIAGGMVAGAKPQ